MVTSRRKLRSYHKYAKRGKARWWHGAAKAGAGALVGIGIKQLKKKLGLNTENKNYDVSGTQAITGACAPWLTPTASLAQGNTNITRSGNSLRITHWKLRGTIYNAAANVNYQQVRVICTFMANSPTAGTVVTPAQLLQTTTNIVSPYNTDLEGVRVIYDKIFVIKPQITGQVVVVPFKFKWSPSYDMGHVQWTDADTTGLVANMTKGIIRIFIFDDQGANHPSVDYYSRVHFVDN